MHKCDDNDHKFDTTEWLVVTPRPSDPTEIVSILVFCEEHAPGVKRCTVAEVAEDLAHGASAHSLVTRELMDEYMESPLATKNGHIFLTI